MKKFIIIFILLYVSSLLKSQENDKNFFDHFSLHTAIAYDLNMQKIRLDICPNFFIDDIGKSDAQGYSWLFNHNAAFGLETNFLNGLSLGPKLAYEINYILLQGRFSLIDLMDLKGENNLIFRPEIGLTLIGLFSINYGYNYCIIKNVNDLIGKHQIGISFNLFYF